MEVKPGFARGRALLLGSESIGRGDDDLGSQILYKSEGEMRHARTACGGARREMRPHRGG